MPRAAAAPTVTWGSLALLLGGGAQHTRPTFVLLSVDLGFSVAR